MVMGRTTGMAVKQRGWGHGDCDSGWNNGDGREERKPTALGMANSLPGQNW
jgi:hypothetical protein